MMEPQHQYTNVHSHDHHHDDDSSTEVESLVGMEKQWAAGEFEHRRPRTRRQRIFSSIAAVLKWVVVIALQLIIIGLLARDQGLLESTRWRSQSTSANDVGGDITGWGPHGTLSFSQRTFAFDSRLTVMLQSQLKSPSSRSTKPSPHTTHPNSSSPKPSEPGTN